MKCPVIKPNTIVEGDSADLLKGLNDPGDLVLDPFIGGGTTAKVAVDKGRNAIGFDIVPEYVEMANREVKG